MSSESKVEFLPKLVKGLKWEMRSTVRGRVKCVVRAERENREALGQSESVKGSDFCLLHSGWSFDHHHLYHP
ncbi:unnamed protein product [Brassica oleracea var. botrytis]